jgi:hypothetical protein
LKIENCKLKIWALYLIVIFIASAPQTSRAAPPRKTENVILITYDGLRWQEVFSGCDETLLNKDQGGGVRDLVVTRGRYWRETAEERREALLPFFWKTVARQGQVFGDPQHGSRARVTNRRNFSYPGYNEILTGFADDKIDSNDKKYNHNVSVLEWLEKRPGFSGRVAAFCSWDVFPFIINVRRSGLPVNAGWQPFDVGTNPARLAALNDAVRDTMRVWDNVRDDGLTFHGALEYVQVKHPRVLYISFGETDDWAHEGRYDLVLNSARRTDEFIERLWSTLQSMPEYAGKTSLVLTTDHGRGDTRVEWKSHGKDIAASDRMWIAVLGPDTPSLGCLKDQDVTQSQVAATVAALLGEDYHAAAPQSGAPLPVLAK